MATCKDCLHCEACTRMLQALGYTVDGDGQDADKRCDTFKFKPLEGIAIVMTPEEWETVRHWLQYGADYHHAKMQEWLMYCVDQKTARERAAEHEREATKAESLGKAIEAELHPTPPPKTE